MAKSQSTPLLAEQATLYFQYNQKTPQVTSLQCSLWHWNPSQSSFEKTSLNRAFGSHASGVAISFNGSDKEQYGVPGYFCLECTRAIYLVNDIGAGSLRVQPVIIAQTTPSSRTAHELHESGTLPLEEKSFQPQDSVRNGELEGGVAGILQACSHEADPKTRPELHNEHHQVGISIGNQQLNQTRKLWMLSALAPALLGISAAVSAAFLSIFLAHVLVAILSQRKLRGEIQRHRYEHYGTGNYHDEESLPALQILK